jgi:blue copper oxidase
MTTCGSARSFVAACMALWAVTVIAVAQPTPPPPGGRPGQGGGPGGGRGPGQGPGQGPTQGGKPGARPQGRPQGQQPASQASSPAQTPAPANAPRRPFQPLWIPPLLEGDSINLTLSKGSKSFWKGATTDTYSFNETGFWGPTLILEAGHTVDFTIRNELDEPTSVHWHGLHIPAAADGGPHQQIAPGGVWKPSFTVRNNASTYWYHPHQHETTQKQLTYGAGGFIIVRDANERQLKLPREYGVDDIPLVLTSRRFSKNDQFSFEGDRDKYGDYLLVNGTLDAQVKLPAQFVRLRLLNAEIERGYVLGFPDNRTFHLIATDGGLVEKPVPLTRLPLMVGERAEILVDLSHDAPGSTLDLMSYNANHPFGFPGGEPGTSRPNGSLLNNIDFRVLKIDVGVSTPNKITSLPGTLTRNVFPSEASVTTKRRIRIDGQPGREVEFMFDEKPFDMLTTNMVVKLGDTEAWTISNDRVFGHSFHVHDVQFKIIARSNGPVEPYEQGWKDTLYVPKSTSATFIAKFDDFASDADPYMYHCHMSNHEDMGLMGQFIVSENPARVKRDGSGLIRFRDAMTHPLTPELAKAAAAQASTIAPALVARDVNGTPISLAEITAKRPAVLFFIERECPCARDAAAWFSTLQRAFAGTCDVIGVINADAPTARAWAEETKATFTIVPDPQLKLIKSYRVTHAASSTIVDKGGMILRTQPGYSRATFAAMVKTLSERTHAPKTEPTFDSAPSTEIVGCEFPSDAGR